MNESYYGEANVVAFRNSPEEKAKTSHLSESPECYTYIKAVGSGWLCSRCGTQYPRQES